MLKKDLLELIKDLQDDNDVDELLSKSELANKLGSLDVFKEKINIDKDFKSFIDSLKDQHLSKGIDTWKTNNLQKLIDEKIKELYPEEDPKDNELKKLKLEIENMKKETLKKELANKALKIATEKNLPVELVDFFIAENEENTVNNLGKLEGVLNQIKIKSNSYTPPANDGGGKIINPWKKETFNLTDQGKMFKENPEQAKQLMVQAGVNI